jgi:hypothetical protein
MSKKQCGNIAKKLYIIQLTYFFFSFSDYDKSDDAPTPKNPMAAAGAVKDALATGGVDKVENI